MPKPPGHAIIDLTHPLTPNIQVYPGDPPFNSTPCCTIPSDGLSVHRLSLGTHTGTHIDAPSHFIPSGKPIGQIPLTELVSRHAVIVDLSKNGLSPSQKITWEEHLKPYGEKMSGDKVLVIYTGWSDRFWGSEEYFDHPYLTKEAAEKVVVEKGVRVLAVDTASPDATNGNADGFGVHETVLGMGGVIVENLANVNKILDGEGGDSSEWVVSFVPLYLGGEEDGSPIRAFAWKQMPSVTVVE
jgi:kynurenine formamidase